MILWGVSALAYGKTLKKIGLPYPKMLSCIISLGDGRRLRFWKDIWCSEVALSTVFPTLFNLTTHKDAKVVDVWDYSRVEGGWSPVFLRSFNDWEVEEVEKFLRLLHNRKISPDQEDKL